MPIPIMIVASGGPRPPSPREQCGHLEKGIERLLDRAMSGAIGEAELTSMSSEVEAQLKPYKRHMDKDAFAQTRDNLLRKRIREHFGVPRLSLFFLHP